MTTPTTTPVPITVFGKPEGCPQCNATKRHLDKAGIPYHWRDVTADPEAHAEASTYGYLGVPIVVAGDMHWQGFRPDRLDALGKLHTVAADVHALDAEAEAYLAEQEGEPLLTNAYLTDEGAASRLVNA